jgi:hypothetical protein
MGDDLTFDEQCDTFRTVAEAVLVGALMAAHGKPRTRSADGKRGQEGHESDCGEMYPKGVRW